MHKKEKNAEHTRMYTIFRNFFSPIFTSVVVYSRTSTNQPATNNKKGLIAGPFLRVVCRLSDHFQNNLHSCATQKERSVKKMRSTHACTPSCATFSRNIHGGCCLFSHKSSHQNKKSNMSCGSLIRF